MNSSPSKLSDGHERFSGAALGLIGLHAGDVGGEIDGGVAGLGVGLPFHVGVRAAGTRTKPKAEFSESATAVVGTAAGVRGDEGDGGVADEAAPLPAALRCVALNTECHGAQGAQ